MPLHSSKLIAAVAALLFIAACSKSTESEDAMMKAGLEALYTRNDPNAAAAQFGKILERNPNHYGATFHLAMALDRAGKPAEAQPLWEKMLAMAEAVRDGETTATARARIGQSGSKSEDAVQAEMMSVGLDLLYTKRDPSAAADQFRKLLERNRNHYGATFQLAMALDRAGKSKEARPLWEKMLKMAESINDKETTKTVRDRLARRDQ